jgi:hypothetical protein
MHLGVALDLAAVILPTLLSVVGVLVSIETPRLESKKAVWGWRIGLVAFGLIVSVVTFEQQKLTRDAAEARINEEYMPSIFLIYNDSRFEIHNVGKLNLYLWGDRLDNGDKTIAPEPRIIPPTAYYYLFGNTFEKDVLAHTGPSGEARVNFEIYVSDERKKKFTGKFELLVKVQDNKLAVHTQMVGLEEGGW